MTFEKLVVPGLTDAENDVLNRLAEQLARKSRRNLLRSSYYDGKRAAKMVGTVIPPQYANIGLALGWAAKGVDGLARRCNLEEMIWADGDIGSLGISELVDSNYLFSEISQARTDSLIHGVSYLITTKGDASKGEPAALVHQKDALNALGEWNPRTRKLDNLLSVTAREDNRITGFVLYLFNLTINADKINGKWFVERSNHSYGVPVEPLVYRPRGSRRMGRSRISRPAMAHQDAALRALIRMEAHMDVYTIPKLILLGGDDSIFKNADGSQKASWQLALGRVFGIPDDEEATAGNERADVKQFDAQSPDSHLSQLNALAKLMAREVDLPDSDFALTDMANPTSEGSYEYSFDSLVSEAEGAIGDWSIPIRRTVNTALAIQNSLAEVPDDWRSIETKWRSPKFVSRSAAADAGAKQIGVVPWLADTEVGLELLGLTEQQIRRAMAEKRRAAGRDVIRAITPQVTADGNG